MSEWNLDCEEKFANSMRGRKLRGVAAALFVALCFCSYKYNVYKISESNRMVIVGDTSESGGHVEIVDDTSKCDSNDVAQTDGDL